MHVVFWLILMMPDYSMHIGTYSTMEACKTAADSAEPGHWPTNDPNWTPPWKRWGTTKELVCIQANDGAVSPPN